MTALTLLGDWARSHPPNLALIGALGQPDQLDEHLVLSKPFHVRQRGGPESKTRHDLRHQRDRGKARGLLVPRIDAIDPS